jgi:Icc-related predicted phosphoesterase
MRVRIFSDLHLEFAPLSLPSLETDLIIAAGDIDTKENGLEWLKTHFSGLPVAYVLGNHEFYGAQLPRLTEKLVAKAAKTSINVLENKVMEFGGYSVFGATLWTDFNLLGDAFTGAATAGDGMTDYKRIRHWPSHRKLTPRHTREIHANTVALLETFLQGGDPRKKLVVTHHAPSLASLPLGWRTDPLSCAYASSLDALIERYQPALWVHGHIHHAMDYRIGATRVLSNPRGYPSEVGVGFRPDLVVEFP